MEKYYIESMPGVYSPRYREPLSEKIWWTAIVIITSVGLAHFGLGIIKYLIS
jgi:predicted cobalt transporter CbtA